VGTLVSLAIEAMDEAGSDVPSDPLERSDREQDLLRELEERGIGDADEIATTLVEGGLGGDWVGRVASALGDERLGHGLRFVAACAASRLLLAELRHETGRIGDLVGAVKGYSFLDQAPKQRVDINEGIENTLAILAHKLREGRIVIVRDLDPTLPEIDAYGSELNQVWTNLIDNAIDALDGEGRITLRTGRDGERLVVEVVDDGPGIPPDVQKQVFDAFFTTKGPGRGTGLGLDIARRIVLQHRGELQLDSRPGETRFRVLLPTR
jgi:signal transduction histidine kinase